MDNKFIIIPFNRAYTPGNDVSSPSPSPPSSATPSPHLEHLSKPVHTGQLLNIPQANLQSLDSNFA